MEKILQVNFNTEELQAKLNSLAGRLHSEQMGRAIALGINQTIRQVKTRSDREIRAVYNVRQSFVLKHIKLKNAKISDWVGELKFPTKPIAMRDFMGTTGGNDPRKSAGAAWKRKRGMGKGNPIKVRIFKKGDAKEINGGFFLNSNITGSFSVMLRSKAVGTKSYNNNGFMFRHKRTQKRGNDLKIGALYSPSAFSTVINKTVQAQLYTFGSQVLQKNVFNMLDKMADGLIRDSKYGHKYKR